jgi:predicted trehalose synthase
MLGSLTMRIAGLVGSVGNINRKLRAVAAVIADPAATEHERANAQALKARLERRLREAGAPAGDWTDNAFRLGKWAKELRQASSPASPNRDWTDNAHRLGKAVRRGYKRWLSE